MIEITIRDTTNGVEMHRSIRDFNFGNEKGFELDRIDTECHEAVNDLYKTAQIFKSENERLGTNSESATGGNSPENDAEEITKKHGPWHPACFHEKSDNCSQCHPDCLSCTNNCGCGAP